MKLNKPGGEFFIPDNTSIEEAIKRTTHMAIAAHQDDIEIMAYDGIQKCFGCDNEWFFGTVVTNGAGSPRNARYKEYTDEQMQKVRKLEQKKAAYIGEFGALALLDYASNEVKKPTNEELVEELAKLITQARPRVIYTHNLADKHDTHVAVVVRVIQALRKLPKELRPQKVYGCEVWRSLDWVNDQEKVLFDLSAHPNLAEALVQVFDSQICGGKRYDKATQGRRLANATYTTSHEVDAVTAVGYGMELTELVENPTLEMTEYIRAYIRRFEEDVMDRINKIK